MIEPARHVPIASMAWDATKAQKAIDEIVEELLLTGGELTWKAGPLAKGSNLCHGSGGNGYAFLKLFRRTDDMRWLERARAFAMTAITQCREARHRYGRGRYSIWTGDAGARRLLT